MKKEGTILGIMIYFPLIVYFFLLLVKFEVIFLNYLCLLYFVYVIYQKKLEKKVALENKYFKWFVLFNVCYTLVGFLNLALGGIAVLNYFAKHFGVFLSIAVIYYLSLFKDEESIEIFNHVAKIAGIMFVIQLLYSMYESTSSDVYIVNSFDWNGTFADFEYEGALLKERLQIEYFFQYLQLPINLVFTGMLGQHNHWGTQLPFYNLIFLHQYFYYDREKKTYLFLALLTFIAAVLNTSRFGIIAIFISTLFFFARFARISNRTRLALGASFVLVVLAFLSELRDTLETYLTLTDTFSTRQDTWAYLWPNVWNRNIFKVLFGSTLPEIVSLTSSLDTPDFENLSYSLLFEKGLLVYFFFIFVLFLTLKKDKGHPALSRFTNKFVVLNIIFVSLWSNVVFRYTSYALLTLLLYRTSMSTETVERNKPMIGVI